MAISNFLPSSRISQSGVCTSTTRPASPYEGQVIYETDTDRVLVWNGSAWYPNWNTAWGMVVSTSATATTSFSASTALEVLSSAGTIVAGRTYKIMGKLNVQTSSSATPNSLYWTGGGLTKSLWYQTTAIGANLNLGPSGFDIATATDLSVTSGSSSVTFKLYWKCGAGGSLSTNPDGYVGAGAFAQQLVVEDIGPA